MYGPYDMFGLRTSFYLVFGDTSRSVILEYHIGVSSYPQKRVSALDWELWQVAWQECLPETRAMLSQPLIRVLSTSVLRPLF